MPGVLKQGLVLSYEQVCKDQYRASLRFENGEVKFYYGRGPSEKDAAVVALLNYWEIKNNNSRWYNKEEFEKFRQGYYYNGPQNSEPAVEFPDVELENEPIAA